jgi:riboflavin kinase/FMN adenylyltransferase
MSTFTGIVMKGKRRGSALGYPTVNIPLSDKALSGIFAGTVTIDGAQYHAAVFADQARAVLEAHLFDFTGDVYGRAVTVAIQKKIRDAETFDTDHALKAAIAEDIIAVRQYFSL